MSSQFDPASPTPQTRPSIKTRPYTQSPKRKSAETRPDSRFLVSVAFACPFLTHLTERGWLATPTMSGPPQTRLLQNPFRAPSRSLLSVQRNFPGSGESPGSRADAAPSFGGGWQPRAPPGPRQRGKGRGPRVATRPETEPRGDPGRPRACDPAGPAVGLQGEGRHLRLLGAPQPAPSSPRGPSPTTSPKSRG